MTATLLPNALDRARNAVQPAMEAAVDRLDPDSRAIAAYHLGWTEADGTPRPGGAGKGVRQTLAVISAEVAGATAEVGVPGAVAVELVHNFSLLHDDVMDRDTERRHRRTVWSLWGESAAILTGDAMLALAVEVLLESPSPHAAAAARELMAATRELIRGQVADLSFESRTDVGLEECLDMADGKTGALLAVSSCIGAILAGAPRSVVDALRDHGRHVGAAFQLVDDLLGIWGSRRPPASRCWPTCATGRSRCRSPTCSARAAPPVARWPPGTPRTAPGTATPRSGCARSRPSSSAPAAAPGRPGRPSGSCGWPTPRSTASTPRPRRARSSPTWPGT